MKVATVAAALGLASSALAWNQPCLTQQSATTLVNDFISAAFKNQSTSYGSPYDTLEAIFAPGYEEISDSILSLEERPLGTVPTAKGKQQIIKGTLQTPTVPSVTSIEILVAGCNKIVWYWLFQGIGSGQDEVKGINILTTTSKGQIQSQVIEFNSIAWGTDTHQLPPQCYGESANSTSSDPPSGAGAPTSATTS